MNETRDLPRPIVIRRFNELTRTAALEAALDAVFFEASTVKTFASDAERAAFRERWLGRYLIHDPQWTYVALAGDGEVAGYLAGSIEDPALAPRFSDIAYFAAFADLTRRYPAHLHVNLAPADRNRGIGSALIQRFAADVASAGVLGVHVVTGRGARNVSFYTHNGFREAGAWGKGASEVVFLARDL